MKNIEKKKTVTTFSGATEFAVDCKLINKQYYKKGNINYEHSGDVFYMEESHNGKGAWRRLNAGGLFFDHSIKQYRIADKVPGQIIQKGVIHITDEGALKFGSFSLPVECLFPTRINTLTGIYICINENIVKYSKFYKELLHNGIYYMKSRTPAYMFTLPIYNDTDYKYNLPYNSQNGLSHAKNLYDILYSTKANKAIKNTSGILRNLSFGLEFETISGIIPENKYSTLGMIPLRDGSINGIEYATIPLTGEKGVQTLVDITKELKKRTRYDKNCSLHIHYGGIPRTESFIVALFKVLYILQEEMYDMFPFYKFKNCRVKRKHYTKALPTPVMLALDSKITKKNIKENFTILYEYFSMGHPYSVVNNDLNAIMSHPGDPSGNHKWNVKTRYSWVNFIPLIFGNKQTVEFRIHTPTYDTTKIINFLYLCGNILNFVVDNERRILESLDTVNYLTLSDIANYEVDSFPGTGIELSNYIKKRKKFKIHNVFSEEYLKEESKFVYNSTIINYSSGDITTFNTQPTSSLSDELIAHIDPSASTLHRTAEKRSRALIEYLESTTKEVSKSLPKKIDNFLNAELLNDSIPLAWRATSPITEEEKAKIKFTYGTG